MYAWSEDRPDDNLALRLTDEEIGIDVDNYGDKNGAPTLAEGEKRWGTLPPTYRSTSRDDGVSGIKLFRVPPGTVLHDRIKVPELGLGGIEICQRHHRFVMVWPSIHPERRQYRWFNETTGEWTDNPPSPAHLADLPPKWIEGLSVNGSSSSSVDPDGETYDVNLALTDGEPSVKVASRLARALVDAAGQNRHDDTLGNVLALLRYGKNGEPGVKVALIAVRAAFISAVTADGSRTEYEASKEFERKVYGERAAKLLGAVVDANPIAAFFQPGGAAAVAAAAKIDEDTLWNAYPELTSCRDYASSVRVGPLAMLGSALTLAAATIPPDVVLPDIVGDYASANLYTGLVGPSGAIKSQAVAAARAWLQTPSPPDPVKPGSGQGVAKCFAYVKKTKSGEPVQVGKRWTAVAMIPEVDTLTAAGSMTGSSLWAELRSAWSDERVGHDYADATKTVVLQPRPVPVVHDRRDTAAARRPHIR